MALTLLALGIVVGLLGAMFRIWGEGRSVLLNAVFGAVYGGAGVGLLEGNATLAGLGVMGFLFGYVGSDITESLYIIGRGRQ